ncbi:hypothetical protein PF010_g2258 [Phytophthora fragariae]|uniref:Ubiquitin-like protease family profile domain-containing protein n=1 Tax=Phytophthora fragariae TaxID=53985 RepID=A0A6G0LYR4_9STRA|nr:hypothetical protein PF010_g2258 [Phytophthora fragariae]
MFVAREGHGFDELPPIALDTRWNMVTAGSLTDQIAKGVADIAPVLDNVKLKKSRNVNASSNVMPDSLSIYSRSTSQVVFVRLERTERTAHIVLTHAEKYNIARSVFDPVLEAWQEVLDQYPVIMDDMVLAATSPTVFETSDSEAQKASYATDEYQHPDRVPKEFVQSPQQPAGGSCGIMVLAMVHTLARVPSRGFVIDNVTADYVKVIRLRFLWVVMCGSLIHATEQGADDAARATDEDLVNAFKTQAPKKR